MKKWNNNQFWGLSADHDPDWLLTEEQKSLRENLIELCRKKIRPQAAHYDRNYIFPRESLNALASLKLLGLMVPKELGGLGQNHTCLGMVTETIARYGCPSTAMVFTMHQVAVATLLFRYHGNARIQDLLTRLDKEKLVGTISYSDPATGGHFWFHLSSKIERTDGGLFKLLKYGSWATSCGYADWYSIQTSSPDAGCSKPSCVLVFKDEVRAHPEDWSALGMRGNMSGPLIIEGLFDNDRMIGSPGEGEKSIFECASPVFFIMTSSVYNGISLASMDAARRYVNWKVHGDTGKRVADYETIQDIFGESLSHTNASRALIFLQSEALDRETSNNDWSLYKDPEYLPRLKFAQWLMQCRLISSKNVEKVTEKMLHACGGSGYKSDLGLERLLRDGRAGWLMSPSNEVILQIIGKTALGGPSSVDLWNQCPNERILHNEVNKLSLTKRKELAMELMRSVEAEERGDKTKHPFQDTDFDNPFNTCPPRRRDEIIKTPDGVYHQPALRTGDWVPLKLRVSEALNDNIRRLDFSLPRQTDYTGCYPGQYIAIRVEIDGREHRRFLSPVSRPNDYGRLELVLRFEPNGILSRYLKQLKAGDKVDFLGPCGGFEYEADKLHELTFMASGTGVTPAMQIIRSVMHDAYDSTKIKLLYYSAVYEDILFREELDTYAAKDPRFHVIYTVGDPPENWVDEEGPIDTRLIDTNVSKPSEKTKHKIVLCGGPTMVVSCLHSLRSLGFPSSSIFVFGQMGTEFVRSVYGRNAQLSSHWCY